MNNQILFSVKCIILEIDEVQNDKRRCESDFDLAHPESALALFCVSEIEKINTEIDRLVSVLKEKVLSL